MNTLKNINLIKRLRYKRIVNIFVLIPIGFHYLCNQKLGHMINILCNDNFMYDILYKMTN